MKVLAAIPACNERKTITSVVMLSKEHVDTVLVIDDGSMDKTALLSKLAGAEVIQHDMNQGKGAALLTALKWADQNGYDIIVFIDADGQHDPGAISRLVEPIKRGECDITIGSRWFHDEGLSEMPIHRIIGNWVLSTTTSLSLSKLLRDSQSGFRAFHMRTLPSFLQAMESGFAVESEMITLADKAGFRWKEVGIKASYGDLDSSTQGPLIHGLSVLGRALKVLRIHKPIRFFGSLSIASFMIAIGISFWGRIAFPDENLLPLGVLYFVASLIIIGGFFMFSAIMLSGINHISKKIFDIVLDIIQSSKH
ncbi:MAG: glycosyltransferase family 2 protein [Candidatus Thermoplasmatota archaeon]|nr:glycosyltransferase family 2 protein [Candidatus Thermoplasmatota archaeon]